MTDCFERLVVPQFPYLPSASRPSPPTRGGSTHDHQQGAASPLRPHLGANGETATGPPPRPASTLQA